MSKDPGGVTPPLRAAAVEAGAQALGAVYGCSADRENIAGLVYDAIVGLVGERIAQQLAAKAAEVGTTMAVWDGNEEAAYLDAAEIARDVHKL